MDFQVPRKSSFYCQFGIPTEIKPLLSPEYILQSATVKVMLLSLLVFVNLLGTLAQEDLQKKVFVFPTASNLAHVILKTTLQQPLTSFTVCLRSYTDLTRPHSPFSYATRRNDNELLLFKQSSNEYQLWVGNECVLQCSRDTVFEPWWGARLHELGVWQWVGDILWLNGQPFPRKGLKKGYSISPEASIIIGQEQDSFGGGFDVLQSFVGEIEDVHMVDWVLSPEEVFFLQFSSTLPNSDYRINWRSLSYDIQGDVVVEPSLFYSN